MELGDHPDRDPAAHDREAAVGRLLVGLLAVGLRLRRRRVLEGLTRGASPAARRSGGARGTRAASRSGRAPTVRGEAPGPRARRTDRDRDCLARLPGRSGGRASAAVWAAASPSLLRGSPLQLPHVGDDRPAVGRRDGPAVGGHQAPPVGDHLEELAVHRPCAACSMWSDDVGGPGRRGSPCRPRARRGRGRSRSGSARLPGRGPVRRRRDRRAGESLPAASLPSQKARSSRSSPRATVPGTGGRIAAPS